MTATIMGGAAGRARSDLTRWATIHTLNWYSFRELDLIHAASFPPGRRDGPHRGDQVRQGHHPGDAAGGTGPRTRAVVPAAGRPVPAPRGGAGPCAAAGGAGRPGRRLFTWRGDR